MAINLHIWPLICILLNIAHHLSLKTGPILFTDVPFIDKDISVVHFVRLVTDLYKETAWHCCKRGNLAAILFMQIRWSRSQNFAWEPGLSDSAYSN